MNTRQEKLTKIEAIIREVCTELAVPHDFEENGPEFELLPIHLEHTLRAINKEGYKNGFMNDIFHSIGSNGQIVMISVGDIFEELCVFDLTKPLHLQSDEFISWLYEVLVGE